MKKVFVFMMATVVALGLASCSKMEDPAQPIQISTGDERSAIIEGNLLIVTDLKASPNKYEGAAGVEIVVTIPNKSILAPIEEAKAPGNWMGKFTTDADGKFTLNIPANPGGVEATITVNEIRGEQRTSTDKVLKGKWKFTIAKQNVVSGQKLILEQTVGNFVEIKEKGDDK